MSTIKRVFPSFGIIFFRVLEIVGIDKVDKVGYNNFLEDASPNFHGECLVDDIDEHEVRRETLNEGLKPLEQVELLELVPGQLEALVGDGDVGECEQGIELLELRGVVYVPISDESVEL